MKVASWANAIMGASTLAINVTVLILNENILDEAEKVQKKATEMSQKV